MHTFILLVSVSARVLRTHRAYVLLRFLLVSIWRLLRPSTSQLEGTSLMGRLHLILQG
jgi:hypothetical protein